MEVMTQVEESEVEEEKSTPSPSVAMIQKLLGRVVHDHMPNHARSIYARSSKVDRSLDLFVHDMSKRKRGVKTISKRVVQEARYLLNEAKLSLSKVSRRLGLGVYMLKRIRESQDPDYNPLVGGGAKVPRFHKIHQRARDLIDIIIDQAKTPLCLRQIQEQLAVGCHLRVSRPYIGEYLRLVANTSFRKIKPIMPIHNELRCKLQR
jgi:hypothetical protein